MEIPYPSSFGPRELCPEGAFAGRCQRIIDLGTQPAFKENEKPTRKLMISFEIYSDPKMADGRPFMLSLRVSRTFNERGNLAKYLTNWLGKEYTKGIEEKTFKIQSILGKAGLLTVQHTDRNGKIYANITSVGPLPKGFPVETPVNPPVIFSLDPKEFSKEVFDSLPEFQREMIQSSPEYQSLKAHPIDEDIPF